MGVAVGGANDTGSHTGNVLSNSLRTSSWLIFFVQLVPHTVWDDLNCGSILVRIPVNVSQTTEWVEPGHGGQVYPDISLPLP